MIESTGGVRADYGVLDRKLLFSLEAFDFSRERDLDPHLRVSTTWRFHPNLYLMGGYDDFLAEEYESFFVGGGVTWSDDDLKYLLGSLPSF
jgi:phospholipid/cholesterol/gamma-HCH transport system substrate-binding protein